MIKPIEQQVQVSDDALRFINAMMDSGVWSANVLASFLEKPWHWDEEFALWNRYSQPDETEPQFGAFLEAHDNLTLNRNTR